ncbi:MAG: type II toxin-antitoxin system VapC family toxin [Thermodesulfobacteriota bacterium]
MVAHLLIDTDVLIDCLRGYPQAVRFLEERDERLFVSAITAAELYAGVREGDERFRLDRFLQGFEIVPIDLRLAISRGLHRREFGKSHGVGLADAIIAVTAIHLGSLLVTLNRKHFPMLENVLVPYDKKEYHEFQ